MMAQTRSKSHSKPISNVRHMPHTAIYQMHTTSPLGDVLLASTEQGLAGMWFVHRQAHMPDSSQWLTDSTRPELQATVHQLAEYFQGKRQAFDVPLDLAWGTPFQRAVWQALQDIPYGQTRTYGDIARHIDNPKAVRAVGAAIGQNPHSIVVPCHRVVGANGSLTGFAGGLDRKTYLLALEATHA